MGLLLMFQSHGTGALVVSSMLDFLTFALCVPYSETTDGKHFDNLLEMVADRGRSLFRLFQVCCPSNWVPIQMVNICHRCEVLLKFMNNLLQGLSYGRGSELMIINVAVVYWWKWNLTTLCVQYRTGLMSAWFTLFPSDCDSTWSLLTCWLQHLWAWVSFQSVSPGGGKPNYLHTYQSMYSPSFVFIGKFLRNL